MQGQGGLKASAMMFSYQLWFAYGNKMRAVFKFVKMLPSLKRARLLCLRIMLPHLSGVD